MCLGLFVDCSVQNGYSCASINLFKKISDVHFKIFYYTFLKIFWGEIFTYLFFQMSCSIAFFHTSSPKPMDILIWGLFEFVDRFRENREFHIIESFYPRTRCVFPFNQVFLISFSRMLKFTC